MAFLLAFACTVSSIGQTGTLVCSDRNRVTLAGIRATRNGAAPQDVVGRKLRCQAFASAGPGELTATCRYSSGEDVGCDFVARGLAKSVPRERRRHELASCDHRLTSAQQGPQSI